MRLACAFPLCATDNVRSGMLGPSKPGADAEWECCCWVLASFDGSLLSGMLRSELT